MFDYFVGSTHPLAAYLLNNFVLDNRNTTAKNYYGKHCRDHFFIIFVNNSTMRHPKPKPQISMKTQFKVDKEKQKIYRLFH